MKRLEIAFNSAHIFLDSLKLFGFSDTLLYISVKR